MNLNTSDLLIQISATVVGGIVLFLLGLAYSYISKQTHKYFGFLARSRIVIIYLILMSLALNIYILTKSIFLGGVPFLIVFCTYLLVNAEIKKIKAELLFTDARYWELRDVPRNFLRSCCEAISQSPANNDRIEWYLFALEENLNKMKNDNEHLETYELEDLDKTLTHMPNRYKTHVKQTSDLTV